MQQILRTISLIIFKHSGVYPTFYFFFISNRIKFVALGGEGVGQQQCKKDGSNSNVPVPCLCPDMTNFLTISRKFQNFLESSKINLFQHVLVHFNPQDPSGAIFKARTSKIDKKSTFSHHDMIYINGKLKAYALRICNCF